MTIPDIASRLDNVVRLLLSSGNPATADQGGAALKRDAERLEALYQLGMLRADLGRAGSSERD